MRLALHGSVACWDQNWGALGDGSTISRLTPVDVIGLTDATQLSAGRFNTCVVRASGEAACWGYNAYGQLGNGTHTEEAVAGALAPVAVLDLSDAARVSVGAFHVTAVRTSAGPRPGAQARWVTEAAGSRSGTRRWTSWP